MRKTLTILSVLVVLSLALAACGGGAAPAAGEKVVVKETVIVEVPAGGAAPAAPAVVAPSGYGETLKTIQSRGKIVCGVNANLPGFGYLDSSANFSGFDVDFCRAISAAIFGDPNKIEFRQLSASERFTALQSGEIDVLIRNTTWSTVRDTELGGNFVHTTFYDGQGMMVRKDSGITSLEGLDGGTICVQTGTTTELNLADVMASLNVSYTPIVFEDVNVVSATYQEGRCDGFTTDKSGLVSTRTTFPDAQDHIILDVTMSKEPLGPMVRHGDDQWFDIVQWTVFALFSSEEFGITSSNVDSVKASATLPEVKRLLGVEGELGAKLGLSNDWAYNIIKLAGNYEEIYNRNLGPDTPAFIPRGFNALYTNGGLLYAPPFR